MSDSVKPIVSALSVFNLPSLHAQGGGEGSGVGGGAAYTEAAVPADRPPTPDPSPPLRGGRGEDNATAGIRAGEDADMIRISETLT